MCVCVCVRESVCVSVCVRVSDARMAVIKMHSDYLRVDKLNH